MQINTDMRERWRQPETKPSGAFTGAAAILKGPGPPFRAILRAAPNDSRTTTNWRTAK